MATPPSFSVGQVLTSAQMNAVGLWKVASLTATYGSTTALTFSNVFTSDFTNYRIIIDSVTVQNAGTLNLRMRTGSTNYNTLYYYAAARGLFVNGVGADYQYSNQAELNLLGFSSVAPETLQNYAMDVLNPAVAQRTYLHIMATGYAGMLYYRQGFGLFDQAIAHDGFYLYPSGGGTFGTTVTVYGYRK